MPGLIDDALEQDAQAVGGLGAAADQQASNAILNLRLKQSERAGLGAAIGTAAGYGLARKKIAGLSVGTPDSRTGAGSGSPFGMLFGTMLNKLGGGVLNQNTRLGANSNTPVMPVSGDTPAALVANPSAEDIY